MAQPIPFIAESHTPCPFCSPEIQEMTFLESDHFRAIYNISPILPGHSLLIPVRHIQSMLELSDIEKISLIDFLEKTVSRLLYHFKGDGFNLSLQDGTSAGQTVSHLHFHILPRLSGDLKQPGDWCPMLESSRQPDSQMRPPLSKIEIQSIVERLRLTP